jgi:hypothetical protein
MDINFSNDANSQEREQIGKALAEGAVAAMLEAAFPRAGKQEKDNHWFKPSSTNLPEIELTGQKAGEALAQIGVAVLVGGAARSLSRSGGAREHDHEPNKEVAKEATQTVGSLVGAGAKAAGAAAVGGALKKH